MFVLVVVVRACIYIICAFNRDFKNNDKDNAHNTSAFEINAQIGLKVTKTPLAPSSVLTNAAVHSVESACEINAHFCTRAT
jgi:hypothetical protein